MAVPPQRHVQIDTSTQRGVDEGVDAVLRLLGLEAAQGPPNGPPPAPHAT